MSLLRGKAPGSVFGAEPGRLAYARIELRKGRAVLRQTLAVGLGEGILEAAPLGFAVADRAGLARELTALKGRLDAPVTRASLVLPDDWLRVQLLDFASLPGTHAEVEELVRFKLKKSVPFRVEDLRLTLQEVGNGAGGARRILVALALDRVLASWEDSFAAAGIALGSVQCEAMALWNLAGATGLFPSEGRVLFANFGRASFTLAVGSAGMPAFYRTKARPRPGAGGPGGPGGPGGDEGLGPAEVEQELALSLSHLEPEMSGRPEFAACIYHCSREADVPWVEELLERITAAPRRRLNTEDALDGADSRELTRDRVNALAPLLGPVLA